MLEGAMHLRSRAGLSTRVSSRKSLAYTCDYDLRRSRARIKDIDIQRDYNVFLNDFICLDEWEIGTHCRQGYRQQPP